MALDAGGSGDFVAALAAALERAGGRPGVVGSTLAWTAETGSTNDLAKAAAAAGCPDGAVFLTDAQTRGRGRNGRSWLASPGGAVLLSIVLRPRVGADRLGVLAMLGACAVAGAVESLLDLRCTLKWPNDVELGGRKVAGVLVEASVQGDELEYAVLGIGVNANFDPREYAELARSATSLALAAGEPVDRVALAAELLAQVDRRYALLGRGFERELFGEWRRRLDTLGRRVLLIDAGGVSEPGLAEDVTPTGALVMRRDDGSTRTVHLGDVSVRPDPGSSLTRGRG